jgi:hypothetical protein
MAVPINYIIPLNEGSKFNLPLSKSLPIGTNVSYLRSVLSDMIFYLAESLRKTSHVEFYANGCTLKFNDELYRIESSPRCHVHGIDFDTIGTLLEALRTVIARRFTSNPMLVISPLIFSPEEEGALSRSSEIAVPIILDVIREIANPELDAESAITDENSYHNLSTDEWEEVEDCVIVRFKESHIFICFDSQSLSCPRWVSLIDKPELKFPFTTRVELMYAIRDSIQLP